MSFCKNNVFPILLIYFNDFFLQKLLLIIAFQLLGLSYFSINTLPIKSININQILIYHTDIMNNTNLFLICGYDLYFKN